MKTRVTLLIIGVIVLVGIAAFFTSQRSQEMLPTSGQLTVSTSTITASTTEYTVDAAYPQFGIPTIDSQIKAAVVAGENDLIAQAQQDKPIENGYPQYSFDCIWDSPYVDVYYVSARIVCGTYTGGAHENPIVIGATYDRATGQPLTLDQALGLTGMTLDQVASSSKQQLAEAQDTAPTGMWASGSDPTPDNYGTFILNTEDVVFIFQPYQVAPFSSGTPEVSIPRVK
jgi:hypothetical protein